MSAHTRQLPIVAKIVQTVVLLALVFEAAHAAHIDGASHKGILYLLRSDPQVIARYDTVARAWLPEIPVSESTAPTALAVDDSGVFVSFDRAIYRYPLTGGARTFVTNTPDTIAELGVVGSYLAACTTSRLMTIAIASLQTASTFTPWYGCRGMSTSSSRLKVFGVSFGYSPADILSFQLNASGVVQSQADSPYHGAYQVGSRTWVFPNEAKVVDSSGHVYSTDSLQYLGSFAGAFGSIAFVGDLPVVLRGNTLTAYSNTLLEAGTYTLSSTPQEVFADSQAVYAVTLARANYSMQVVALAAFSAAQPGAPIDPTNLPYTADQLRFDKDNQVLYILSKANTSIFRWSPTDKRYLPSLSLTGAPEFFTVDTANGFVYVAYKSGKINRINLGSPTRIEQPFASLPDVAMGLEQIGPFLFAMDPSGAWGTHYVINGSGQIVSSKEWNYYSSEYVWSAVNNKVYFFKDDTSPNDIVWEDINPSTGAIGNYFDSPYHGDFPATHPIRVSPDGATVVIGSGRVFNAQTLQETNSLSNNILDATWIRNALVTLKSQTSSTIVQYWNPSANYAPVDELALAGTPLRVFATNNGLLVVRQIGGAPAFDVIVLDPASPTPPTRLGIASPSATGMTVSWTPSWDKAGATEYYKLYRDGVLIATIANSTTYSDSSLNPSTIYSYTVAACDSAGACSPASAAVLEHTLGRARLDFNANGKADILWRHGNGDNAIWLMNGFTLAAPSLIPAVPNAAWAISGVGDFDGDGKADILWRNTATGESAVWLMNGSTLSQSAMIPAVPDPVWTIAAIGDFDRDGKSDILWRNTATGDNAIWFMDGVTYASGAFIPRVADSDWGIAKVGDFDGDGRADILWRNGATGEIAVWLMNGATLAASAVIASVPAAWAILAVADYDGSGKADILWRNTTTGENAIWLMDGLTVANTGFIPGVPDANWTIVRSDDYNGDAKADILWRNTTTGQNAIWVMNGLTLGSSALIPGADPAWTMVRE